MSYQKIKGTQDFFGIEKQKFAFIEQTAKNVSKRWGFFEMDTPIFEATELFNRSVGDETDIVKKEMYTFLDKGDRSITLRPEGTASVTRAVVENKLYASTNPLKLSYFGPMFRYERPQAGRLRQFTQFGVEVFGVESANLDADLIYMAVETFREMGIKSMTVKINTLGDDRSKEAYQEALRVYFSTKVGSMCKDCQERIVKNPLRILDCKIDAKGEEIANAPKMSDYLSFESKAYLKKIVDLLEQLDVNVEVDQTLVRGLDYYTSTVFEIIVESESPGMKDLVLCGGGRYNGLSKDLGGPELKAIGYAFGVERVMIALDEKNTWNDFNASTDFAILAMDDESKTESIKLANLLRKCGKTVELDYVNTTLKPQFKLSERINAKTVLLIGEEERRNRTITWKGKNIVENSNNLPQEMFRNDQQTISMEQFFKRLRIYTRTKRWMEKNPKAYANYLLMRKE